MALAKGHSSKTKSQVSDIRTIGPLVLSGNYFLIEPSPDLCILVPFGMWYPGLQPIVV